ncbi:MAG TPA: 3'-5' exonuclease, partial [Longimicrobiaceae bacterium]|nr:3'-5' exonuclease [Longimicrobiaceae bacterium]
MSDPRAAGGAPAAAAAGESLLARVESLLASGPASTAAIASRALGLSGDPAVAARVVWTLLGADARFAVSSDGLWSLAASPAAVLREEEWVVVDVETTGGSPAHGHRVTEVAAVRVSRGEVTESFSTLVNPQRPIPRMITDMTGITNEMVRSAPTFPEVAPRLQEMLRGRVFVAHNAGFDWRFVCSELELCRRAPLSGRQLCTVRLARKLLPQLPSRSLDALALYFDLEIAARHRAGDDALATARLLLHFIEILEERGIDGWEAVEALLAPRAPRRK